MDLCRESSPPSNTPNASTADPNKKKKASKKEPILAKPSRAKEKEKESTGDAMEVEE